MAAESRVLIDKLDNQNWGIWRRKLKALFLSKRLAGVIDGTDEDKDRQKPDPSDVALSVLAGLPKEFSVLVTIVGTLKETQALDEITPALLQTEQQTRLGGDFLTCSGIEHHSESSPE
ncbi:hypothetical protein WJX77_005284 [Trebouxia sp. C0004]